LFFAPDPRRPAETIAQAIRATTGLKNRRQHRGEIIKRMGRTNGAGYRDQRPSGTAPIERLDLDVKASGRQGSLKMTYR
jgi:hypothetical protein